MTLTETVGEQLQAYTAAQNSVHVLLSHIVGHVDKLEVRRGDTQLRHDRQRWLAFANAKGRSAVAGERTAFSVRRGWLATKGGGRRHEGAARSLLYYNGPSASRVLEMAERPRGAPYAPHAHSHLF